MGIGSREQKEASGGGGVKKKKKNLNVTDIYTTRAQMHLAVGSQEIGQRDEWRRKTMILKGSG